MGLGQARTTLGRSAVIAASLWTSSARGLISVPDSMKLTPTMEATDFSAIPLIPLDLTIGVQEGASISASDAVAKQAGPEGAIVFAVRRPG